VQVYIDARTYCLKKFSSGKDIFLFNLEFIDLNLRVKCDSNDNKEGRLRQRSRVGVDNTVLILYKRRKTGRYNMKIIPVPCCQDRKVQVEQQKGRQIFYRSYINHFPGGLTTLNCLFSPERFPKSLL
jgi:hypothetical protein